MELHEPALGTPPAARPHERAAPEVAQPHRALDLGRNVARSGRRAAGRPRIFGRRELFLREGRKQGRESAVEDGGFVAGGDRVAQQVFREPQLLEGVAADRDLDPVAIRRERSDIGPWPPRGPASGGPAAVRAPSSAPWPTCSSSPARGGPGKWRARWPRQEAAGKRDAVPGACERRTGRRAWTRAARRSPRPAACSFPEPTRAPPRGSRRSDAGRAA